MEKIIRISMAFLFAMCLGFSSCGGDDDNTLNPEKPINPVEPSKEQAMSVADQKEYLETVALEFMDKTPASDFDDIADLCMYINDTYGDDYDWDSVDEWCEDVFDAAREALGTKTTENETEKYGRYTYNYTYIYTDYKALLQASNFTGHFTAEKGGWVLEKANDLQFIFTDKKGQKCVLKLETSGSVKKVYLMDDDEWMDYDYNSYGYTYTSTTYYDRTQYTIGIPEQVVVTLTQAGKQVAKASVNIDLGGISDERFDISKSSFNMSAALELNNGYKFNFSKFAFSGNKNASLVFTMSKNGSALAAIGLSSDVTGLPSVNVDAFASDDFDEDDYDFDSATAKNLFVKLDILGKVQMQGTLTDVRKYVDYIDDAEDNDTNESKYKSYIDQANAIADVNLFYDGNNVKQASVMLEPFVEDTWYGRTYWDVEPVICFYDGSSYSTFEAFFNDRDFKQTIDAFKTLANKYAALVDEHIDW